METKIRHYENGESEFTFPVTMVVGTSEHGITNVEIGSGCIKTSLTIYEQDKNEFRVSDHIKCISDIMKSKEECINWIINQHRGY
jgi:hypothetical protein